MVSKRQLTRLGVGQSFTYGGKVYVLDEAPASQGDGIVFVAHEKGSGHSFEFTVTDNEIEHIQLGEK